MIEYANESVIKLLKQYDMFSKTLAITTDLTQKNDICYQMTKIIQNVLELTNTIYEEKYLNIAKRSIYLMDEEKNRLLELINLINERRVYVNNQIINNKELTGLNIDAGTILGEEKLEDYKSKVKIIDKYKSNLRLTNVLKEELAKLDANIRKANNKIANNKKLNRQIEEKMIRTLDNAFKNLSLYELQEREKEIDLAYTELGFSLEKAKENALVARRDCSEDIIVECDNMLASITLEYERYKEKKLILKLIRTYKNPTNNYDELLRKMEEINNILSNITSSELYLNVGNEISKEYATLKLEGQDVITLKSLTQEKEKKEQTLKDITEENNSDEFKQLLSNLLENEKKYQEKLLEEKRKREKERLIKEKEEELKKQEEIAKRQKALEQERLKEIELRTKELLVEKKNPVLMQTREENFKENDINKTREEKSKQLSTNNNIYTRSNQMSPSRQVTFSNTSDLDSTKTLAKKDDSQNSEKSPIKSELFGTKTTEIFGANDKTNTKSDDFFTRESRNTKVADRGIPVIKNDNLDSKVVTATKTEEEKVFPDISLTKQDDIFPDFPDVNENNSFFDEDEFKDLNNYVDDDEKKSWF